MPATSGTGATLAAAWARWPPWSCRGLPTNMPMVPTGGQWPGGSTTTFRMASCSSSPSSPPSTSGGTSTQSAGSTVLFLRADVLCGPQGCRITTAPRGGAGRASHVSASVSRLLSRNECPRCQAGRARQLRGAAPLPARIGPCTGSVGLSRLSLSKSRAAVSGPYRAAAYSVCSGHPAGVCYRRISPVAAHSDDRLLSERAASIHSFLQEPLFMPRSRHQRLLPCDAAGPRRGRALVPISLGLSPVRSGISRRSPLPV